MKIIKALIDFIYKNENRDLPSDKSKGVEKGIVQSQLRNRSIDKFLNESGIPEPTRSLLWVTDEDSSKARHLFEYVIEIRTTPKEPEKDDYNFYAEPSLIWIKIPIKKGKKKFEGKFYWPEYSKLTPEMRWEYLTWLKDISQKTSLSYVFLYYYGLERNLFLGNYENAVKEIIKLFGHFRESGYLDEVINTLITASSYRHKSNIIELAPILMSEVSNAGLYLRALTGRPITTRDLLYLYNSKRYYRHHYFTECLEADPVLFEKELESVLKKYESENGDILSRFKNRKIRKKRVFLNLSLGKNFVEISEPQILYDKEFEGIFRQLFSDTYKNIQEMDNKMQN